MAQKKKKPLPVKKPSAPKGQAASAGIAKRLKEKDNDKTYAPDRVERVARTYIKRRTEEMIQFRKGLGLESRWREADEEYIPHELDFGTTRKRFETDQDTGLRSRMVPVGDVTQQWRQASSAPTLLAKIQTAVSIIVDQQPEAELVALVKKYQATTDLAYALWKRNWQVTEAKEKLKLVIFDLIKYGWAVQRTYPRKVEYDKRVLDSKHLTDPEQDTYKDKKVMWFNDVDRQRLDPYRTWIDELSTPYDPYSTNEAYYEMDFSYDAASVEFAQYPNWQYVKRDSEYIRDDGSKKTNRASQGEENKGRKDVVTVGFFQSRTKDMYGIFIPKDGIVLYLSPLPNDDGYLDVTHTMWILRKSGLPYGVSLWEVIRQNKALYDKMKNMGMDQLVLSIMKFGFFSGTNTAVGDGVIEVVPGQARQLTSSTGKPEVDWMEIPGPGADFWKGIQAIQDMMDDESGITPTMEGDVTGKTLGEILHAKEAALKRLKVPVDNIAWLIEQDAYLTLSWMSQLYAIPTIMEFADEEELSAYEAEEQMTHTALFGFKQDDNSFTGPYQAHFLPQLALHLEDSEGKMVQSKDSKFYQVGIDIQPNQLKWKGIFKVLPRSIIDTSQELVKALKMEMFNMLVPLLQFPPELAARPAQQILKVNEEDPKDWLPDSFIQFLEGAPAAPAGGPAGPGAPAPAGGAPAPMGGGGTPPGGAPAGPGGPVVSPSPAVMPAPGMKAGQVINGQSGATPPQAPTLVPGQAAPSIAQLSGGRPGGLFNKRMQ